MVKNHLYVPSDFTNCRNCGAPIPTIIRGHCTCSYCGTTYTRETENVVVIENRTGILPLNVGVRIRQRLVGLGDEAWNEYARKEMAARLADAIVDSILHFRVKNKPNRCCTNRDRCIYTKEKTRGVIL